MYRLRLLALVALTCVAFARSSFAEPKAAPPENDPLYMRVIATPWPPEAAILDGGGRRHSAYELYVTNFGKTPLKVTRLDVEGKDDDKVILSQSVSGDDQLAAIFMSVQSGPNKAKGANLTPGQTGVFFIFADWLPDQDDPETFILRLRSSSMGAQRLWNDSHLRSPSELGRSDRHPLSASGQELARDQRPVEYLGASLRDMPVNGQPHIGQRYAIDWVQLGADGNTYTGDKSENSSYHAWDQEISGRRRQDLSR